MAVVRVGIVDDSRRDRAHIALLLSRYQDEHGVKCAVREYSDGAALLDGYQADLDVIFLDILMGGIDGMCAAAAIRKADSKVVIIFVTNTAQYATRGYSVQAQSYVLKPVSYFAFETEMNRCLARLRQTERASILIGSGSSVRRMAVADVIYLSSTRHRITVRTADEEIHLSGTLKAFENQLAGHHFYRSNSGYLINLQHLMAIEAEDAVMSNGDVLKISRARKKGVLEALNHYLGGQLA
ncbi:MAG: LytTR family DNA-binding domain-containing protein [Propionibacteriaceae bacterium]|jgi:DNA-binding LytR/AlgR family response regulator|nr:LytTR family DNA-binding domain-containing protein [Propionibacteriaceae bacterium]